MLQMKTEIAISVRVTVGQLYLFLETAVLVFQMSVLSILETVGFNQHERCFEYPLNSRCILNAAEVYRIPFCSVGQEIRKILIMNSWSLFLLSHPALSSVQFPLLSVCHLWAHELSPCFLCLCYQHGEYPKWNKQTPLIRFFGFQI